MIRFINILLLLLNIGNAVMTSVAFPERAGLLPVLAFVHAVGTWFYEGIYLKGQRHEDHAGGR
jgi:hypothetical protein